MPSLLKECRSLFGSDNLYSVLAVEHNATDNELKRAYRKLSLKIHPDRVAQEEKAEATRKFQALGQLYSILSDGDKRKIYDETGEVDEENDVTQDRDWYEYWRLLFSAITLQDVEEFEKQYKGSEEELSDLKSCYLDSKGDMDYIMDNVLCVTIEDEDRLQDILVDLIKKKDIPDFKNFTKESKKKKTQRKRKAEREAAEAEELKTEMGLEAEDSLKAMILQKQEARAKGADDFFAHLEAKYSKPKAKGKKK